MTIQIVSQYYYPDNFRINDIAAELSARGHTVRVLTGLPDYATSRVPREYKFFRRRREQIDGVEVVRAGIIARHKGVFFRILNYGSFVLTASNKALRLKMPDIDVIFVNQTSPVFQAIPAMILKYCAKKPLVLYCYDLWPESMKAWNVGESNPAFKLARRISAWIYRSCDIVAVTSKPFREYLTEICGVDDGKIVYLPQFAEELFGSVSGVYEDNGCIDFLFAGNLGAVQNVDCALKAAAKVRTDKRFCLHIVGDGSELVRLRELAQELRLGDKVRFYGRRPLEEMEVFYRLADCFVLTLSAGPISRTLPGKAQGYLSAGKPIVAAIDGAGYELMGESGCGEAVRANDDEGLAECMARVIENFPDYKQKGANGRRFYDAHFGRDQFFESLLSILER